MHVISHQRRVPRNWLMKHTGVLMTCSMSAARRWRICVSISNTRLMIHEYVSLTHERHTRWVNDLHVCINWWFIDTMMCILWKILFPPTQQMNGTHVWYPCVHHQPSGRYAQFYHPRPPGERFAASQAMHVVGVSYTRCFIHVAPNCCTQVRTPYSASYVCLVKDDLLVESQDDSSSAIGEQQDKT